ncbi:MAG: hypothetical protein M1371_07860 [Actinobacteria bacterium]|nr:hypothetical protein [Actinomycetota bacterium]
MHGTYDYYKFGEYLISIGKHLQAIGYLENAARLEPRKASIRELLAISYYNCKNYLKSEENFKIAIDIDPTNDYAYFGLSRCSYKMGSLQTAIGQLKIAIALSPDNTMYKDTLLLLNRISL